MQGLYFDEATTEVRVQIVAVNSELQRLISTVVLFERNTAGCMDVTFDSRVLRTQWMVWDEGLQVSPGVVEFVLVTIDCCIPQIGCCSAQNSTTSKVK